MKCPAIRKYLLIKDLVDLVLSIRISRRCSPHGCDRPTDLIGDGTVGPFDLATVLDNWVPYPYG